MNKRAVLRRRLISLFATFALVAPLAVSALEAATVNWLSPLSGQKSIGRYVEVAVSYNTQSDLGVTQLVLYIDGKPYQTKNLARLETRGVCSFQWDTTAYVKGSHFLLVKIFSGPDMIAAISGAGNVGEVTSDLTLPSVKFTNIKSGTILSGTRLIRMAAQDNRGTPPLVSLLVDQKLRLLRNQPPYLYDLDTTTLADGEHEIQTYAFDAEGNKSDTVTVRIIVANNVALNINSTDKVGAVNPETPKAAILKHVSGTVATSPVPPIRSVAATSATARASEAKIAPAALTAAPAAVVKSALVARFPAPVVKAPLPVVNVSVPMEKAPASIVTIPSKAVSENPVTVANAISTQLPDPVASRPTSVAVREAVGLIRESSVPTIVAPKLSAPADIEACIVPEPLAIAEVQLKTSVAVDPQFVAVPIPKMAVAIEHPTILANANTKMMAAPTASRPEPAFISKAVGSIRKPTALTTVVPKLPLPSEPECRKPSKNITIAKYQLDTEAAVGLNLKMLEPTYSHVESVTLARKVDSVRGAANFLVASAKLPIPHYMPKIAQIKVNTMSHEPPLSVVSEPVRSRVVVAKMIINSPLANTIETSKAKSPPVPLRIALAPGPLRTGSLRLLPPSSTKADVETLGLPAAGRVRIREIMNKMDDVVLWDSRTRTVTVYVKTMKLQLRIGHNTVKVNGKKMKVNLVPYIVKGRTIIDIRLYSRAFQLAAKDRVICQSKAQ